MIPILTLPLNSERHGFGDEYFTLVAALEQQNTKMRRNEEEMFEEGGEKERHS